MSAPGKTFWDERYQSNDFAYGREPNTFIREMLDTLHPPGKVLFPGEGEGRNAMYAARNGWEVHAFDYSAIARAKALQWAEEEQVKITYKVSTFEAFEAIPSTFDAIGLCFVHMPVENRQHFYPKLIASLRPGGILFMEAFSKTQLAYRSGGPQSPDLLYSEEIIQEELKDLKTLRLETREVHLNEGKYHSGKAEVVRYVGVRDALEEV